MIYEMGEEEEEVVAEGPAPLSTLTEFAEQYLEFQGEPLKFDKYTYMRQQIDDGARTRLMVSARQTGKSLAECVVLMGLASMYPYTTVTYISSALPNTAIFESQKLRPMMESPKWRDKYLAGTNKNNVYEKVLNNGSQIVLRGAAQGRVRGISGGILMLDELQDIDREVVEAAESVMTRAELQIMLLGGTQSHIESSVNHYWDISTQAEYVVLCSHCNKWSDALGESNIGRKSLICAGCGGAMDTAVDRCEWVRMGPLEASVSGYRFPLLALPGHPWSDIINKYDNFTQQMFYLDVLALPYDFAGKPISRAELMELCAVDPRPRWYTPHECLGYRTVAGIDWGHGNTATTQVFVLVEMGAANPLKIAYCKKLVGEESAPEAARAAVLKVVQDYNCRITCADVGGQWESNPQMLKVLGPVKFQPVQLTGDLKQIMVWKPNDGVWSASKSDTLSETFLALKKHMILPPAWNLFQPFGDEILNEVTVYNEDTGKLKFTHPPSRPDDSLHALNFARCAYDILTGKHNKRPNTGFKPSVVVG